MRGGNHFFDFSFPSNYSLRPRSFIGASRIFANYQVRWPNTTACTNFSIQTVVPIRLCLSIRPTSKIKSWKLLVSEFRRQYIRRLITQTNLICRCFSAIFGELLHAVNLNRYKNAHKSSCQRTPTYSPTLGYADRSSVPPPPELVPYPLAGGGRGGDYALVSKSLYFTPEAGISGFIYQVAWERMAFIGWDFYFILWCSSLPKNRRVFRQTLSH